MGKEAVTDNICHPVLWLLLALTLIVAYHLILIRGENCRFQDVRRVCHR